jgi:ABC-type Fe3+/spermidine/putrescine transport system ATPase subunit
LVTEPAVILLDEPLSNLDARLRGEVRDELAALHRELGLTMIYVTHDQEDALTLASRVAILNAGRVEQVGGPEELYELPASPFVARFLGDANLVPRSLLGGAEGIVCIRPEAVDVGRVAEISPGRRRLNGTLERLSFKGAFVEAKVRVTPEVSVTAHLPRETTAGYEIGLPVEVGWDESREAQLSEAADG